MIQQIPYETPKLSSTLNNKIFKMLRLWQHSMQPFTGYLVVLSMCGPISSYAREYQETFPINMNIQ